ncbi:hypothetical protein CWE12_10650 [Aliidiomarina sedimenti]|uniref:YcxB-like protein domain-containing protein n=1 Tax=Aliidiomarina sedimenti TaxID=1933879 RepID=A0ABY0BWM5_9GAMM|nr:hypothetical protein [Aliidiomarina sedimenti]RUO28765.1 hypothetical protein CWE12_10650 [Aliidiomarina sedimenti]
MMKIKFNKKLNPKLVGGYFVLYLLILYWFMTFPPPPEYRAGPLIAAFALPFLIIFTIRSLYHYWTAPDEAQVDLKRRLVMTDSAEIKLGVDEKRLVITAKEGSFSLNIEQNNGHLRGCTSIFFPQALYGCELASKDLKLIIDELGWVTLIEK